MSKKEYRPLGRGLGSVLGDAAGTSSINELPIGQVYPNADQPRSVFDEDALEELAASIRAIGLVQPITVRKMDNGRYMIISGERRWRASKIAGLSHIPAYIKTATDEEMMEMALIENIQREDLNAIEIALAYKSILAVADIQQDELAKRVGKSRSSVSNYLRLLNLPAEVQLGLSSGKIEMGHARTLLSLSEDEDRLKVYATIVNKDLSVRQVESLCKQINFEKGSNKKQKMTAYKKDDYALLSQQLSRFFRVPVALKSSSKGKGRLTISFDNEDQLMHIIEILEEAQNREN